MKLKDVIVSAAILFFIGFGGGTSNGEVGQHVPAIPMAARMVLAKAGGLINQKEYQKRWMS